LDFSIHAHVQFFSRIFLRAFVVGIRLWMRPFGHSQDKLRRAAFSVHVSCNIDEGILDLAGVRATASGSEYGHV